MSSFWGAGFRGKSKMYEEIILEWYTNLKL